MYCTQCHTAFSWNTGRVESGNIHNPHYYEYMRQQNGGVAPRNPGDVPCGGFINGRRLQNNLIESGIVLNNEIAIIIMDYHRLRGHIEGVELPKYVVRPNATNEDLRIKFLVKEIDEKAFKLELQKREKASDKKTEIHQILTTYQTVVMDILNTFDTFQLIMPIAQIEAHIRELEGIRTYTNQHLADLSKVYKCVVPQIIYDNITVPDDAQHLRAFRIHGTPLPPRETRKTLVFHTKKMC
jgi:hypothetical protein